jgi:hypothetical protein
MDFELGLKHLKQQLPTEAMREFAVFEGRLRDNLRRERLYGSTEATRAERAEISDSLNQIALTYLNASFSDLCRRDFEVTQTSIPVGHTGGEKPGQATTHLGAMSGRAEKNLHSLQLELVRMQNNLRLIQERKAEYVISTEIPLNLIKEERHLLDRIAELEQQLSAQQIVHDECRPIDTLYRT